MSLLLKGFSWNFIVQCYKVLFSSLVLIILARLISVNDFGIIGMAMVFVLFLNTIQNIGFDSSIIYSKTFKEEHLFSLLTLNVIIGLLIYISGFFLSPLITVFYDNEDVQIIFKILVLSVLFSSFGVVSKGYLQKKLKFKKLAIIEIIAITISGIIAVILAIKDFGYWSLVAQQVLLSLLTSFGFLIITFKNIFKSLFFSFSIIKEHLNFGYNVFIFNVFNFFAQQLDVLLIGKLLGEKQLGIYLLAFNLILKPITLIVQVFNKTIYPVLTKINKSLIKETYVALTSSFFFFLAPLIIFSISLGIVLIPKILTEKWIATLPLLIVFGYQSIRMSIASPSGLLFLISGNPQKQWKYSVFISLPLRLLGVLLGFFLFNSALGVSIGVNFFATIETLIGFYITFNLINLDISTYFLSLKKYLIKIFLLISVLVFFNLYIIEIWLLLLIQFFVIFIFIKINYEDILLNLNKVKNII